MVIFREDISMRFQLSAFADEAGSSLSEQIAAMRENNIPYLEIRGVDGENISDITNEKAKQVRKQLGDNGVVGLTLRKARHNRAV